MKYTGFLCGAFSTKGTFVPEEKWKSIITSDADRQLSSNYYYPEFVDKLTHLFFCTCKFHSFEDGNKRLAITLSAQFLLINGYMSVAKTFFAETENISYHVAAGNIDKELLHEIMESIMRGDFEENEEVKFKYYTAISGLEV